MSLWFSVALPLSSSLYNLLSVFQSTHRIRLQRQRECQGQRAYTLIEVRRNESLRIRKKSRGDSFERHWNTFTQSQLRCHRVPLFLFLYLRSFAAHWLLTITVEAVRKVFNGELLHVAIEVEHGVACGIDGVFKTVQVRVAKNLGIPGCASNVVQELRERNNVIRNILCQVAYG